MGVTFISTGRSTTKRAYFVWRYPAANSNACSASMGSKRPAELLGIGAASRQTERRCSRATPAFRKFTRWTGNPTETGDGQASFVATSERGYCSFANSDLACSKTGIFGSASFHMVKKSLYAARDFAASPAI